MNVQRAPAQPTGNDQERLLPTPREMGDFTNRILTRCSLAPDRVLRRLRWRHGFHRTSGAETTAAPYRAQNEEGYPDHAAAAAQLQDPGSILCGFRDVMRLRRSCPALQCREPAGESYARVPTGDDRNCCTYLRKHRGSGQTMLVIANLLEAPATFELHLKGSARAAAMAEARCACDWARECWRPAGDRTVWCRSTCLPAGSESSSFSLGDAAALAHGGHDVLRISRASPRRRAARVPGQSGTV